MKKRIYVVASIIILILIIVGVMLSIQMTNKNIQTNEQIGKVEETQSVSTVQALETEPQVPETWDLTKVDPVLSEDNIYVPVPKGFTASKAEGEYTVNTGFVIYEGEVTAVDPNAWTEQEALQASVDKNQFVWIPVENAISRIYKKNATTGKIKARLCGSKDEDTKPEPGVLYDDYIKNFNQNNMAGYTKDSFYKELETEYKNIINSIEKYGGFYIGRYETGALSQNIPVVKRMNTDIQGPNWYKMYSQMRNITANVNVQTSMIWGSLWDETLHWLVTTGCKTSAEINDSTSWGNYQNSTFEYKTNTAGETATKSLSSQTRIPTGSAEYTKANNIYNLAGNVREFALEGDGSSLRFYNGGCYSDKGNKKSVNYRSGNSYKPNEYVIAVGYRACMYVK